MDKEKLEKLGFITAKALREKLKDTPEPRNLFGGWLWDNDACIIESGDNWNTAIFALALSCSIAGSGTMAGWRGEEPRKVFYMSDQSSDKEEFLRFSADMCRKTECVPNLVMENLTVFSGIDASLLDTHTQNEFIRFISEQKFDVVVLDDVHNLFDYPGHGGNLYRWWMDITRFLVELRRDATVILTYSPIEGVCDNDYHKTSIDSCLQIDNNKGMVDLTFTKVRMLKSKEAHGSRTVEI